MNLEPINAPSTSAVNRYALVQGKINIGENVLVSQRAFLDNAIMGDGSNAQENSYIIHSKLAGLNVTAHGGKIIYSDIGLETFVGFNSFLNGKPGSPITIGEGCIVMPHTIIDSDVPINIPGEHLVWGFIGSKEDVKNHTISLDDLAEVRDTLKIGKLTFTGNGSVFIDAFQRRINQVLLANGALFNKGQERGHAQDDQNISFNIIQPYSTGELKGLYPSIRIKP
jgi:carbonic anhydrase/acetyltransferase-like protein (isoleucine patch superfamily)